MVQLLREPLHSVGIQGHILYYPVVMVANHKPCGKYQIFISADLNKVALSPNKVIPLEYVYCSVMIGTVECSLQFINSWRVTIG